MEEAISVYVGNVAVNITKVKEKMILNKEIKKQSCFGWLKNKLDGIKNQILPSIEINDKNSYEIELALLI